MRRLLPPEQDLGVLRAPVRSTLAIVTVFLVAVLAIGLMERIGAIGDMAPAAVIGCAAALYALAAILSHSRRAADFYVADRRIPAPFGGLAAAGALAGILVAGLAAGAYASLAAFVTAGLGLVAGTLAAALLIAPRLRATAAYTPGDLLAARFGGGWMRALFAFAGLPVALLLVVAHLKISAPLVSLLTGLSPQQSLLLVWVLTAFAALPGGMRSLSWTQAIQALVLTAGCIVPAAWNAIVAPAQASLATRIVADLPAALPDLGHMTDAGAALPLLLAFLGAAALPPAGMIALAATSPGEARRSLFWAALFTIMLLVAATVLAQLVGFVGAVIPAAAATSGGGIARLFAALPDVLAGLVLAGALAALFSLGQAALFAAAAIVTHDLYDEVLDRRGPEGRRVLVGRAILVALAALSGRLAAGWNADPGALVSWALALAAAGSLVPLLLALSWRRCNEIGVLGGTLSGFGFAFLVFAFDMGLLPDAMSGGLWRDVGAPLAGAAGFALSLVVTVVLSLITPAAESRPSDMASAGGSSPVPARERPA